MLKAVKMKPASSPAYTWYLSAYSGRRVTGRLLASTRSTCSIGSTVYWISSPLVKELQEALGSLMKLISSRSTKGGDRPWMASTPLNAWVAGS